MEYLLYEERLRGLGLLSLEAERAQAESWMVKHCKSFPRQTVESPSLVIFNSQLDTVLGNLLCRILLLARGWDQMISRAASQPKLLYVKKNFSKVDISSQKNWACWLKKTINNNFIIDKNQMWFCTESSKLYKQKLIFLLLKYSPKYQGKKIKLLTATSQHTEDSSHQTRFPSKQ